MNRRKLILWYLLTFVIVNCTMAQDYDLLIKGGAVTDVKNGISDQKLDIAVADGKIARVAENIPANMAKTVIDANGLIVTPGLIDIHGHVFWGTQPHSAYSNGMNSVAPDGFTFRSGVTTIVDAGSSGWRNFLEFKEQTVDHSKTRVLAFLNIVGSGMKGGVIEQNVNDMDPKLTALMAKRYDDIIVGIKLAHYSGHEWEPTERAVEAGNQAEIPVMIDFGGARPALSLETLFLEKLRPGDIFTHAYASLGSRGRVVNDQHKVEPFVFEAQKRGIIFDVGHGGGSFAFEQAVPAMQQGFLPNSISTDLHIGSMNGGMKDMLNIMSKFLNMNMSLERVIECSTWNPAQYIKHSELGHLSEGAIADIAILRLREGDFGFIDTKGLRMSGNQRLECEVTIRDGKVVYDLNGLASPDWDE
ncbi:MAG: amidohydrolase/deacetylase family metallohydrolase [Saprospiraceae bacterium]|nr:amidohydrolase/deacetylase family metallohydrolase [Saprospiraceae bacterium]